MITANLKNNYYMYDFYGLSTDGKPANVGHEKGEESYVVYDGIQHITQGSAFLEIDTGKVFVLKVEALGTDPETFEDSWVEL